MGNPASDMLLEKGTYWKILRNQLTVKGNWNSSFGHSDDDDWNYVFERLKGNRLHPEQCITHHISFDELNKGLLIIDYNFKFICKNERRNMLRFCEKDFTVSSDIQVTEAEECMFLDKDLWKNGRVYFKCGMYDSTDKVRLLPIVDKGQELVCYGYQDNEANRELRMLKELAITKGALQFEDIFPDIRRVVIYGCNELAYFFARYLEGRQIPVLVTGKYWDFMGYIQAENIVCDKRTMVVYAEEFFQSTVLEQTVFKSVSPEFECIDKIYEANVLDGRIRDTIGNFDDFLYRLNGEREIVILGDGRESQDAYDLLLKNGIDICGFALETNVRKRNLLGKEVISIDEAIMHFHSPIFLECHGHNGAFGGKYTEYFDYYGYERNKQFFLIRDYADIPISNLVHVLYGKKVVLAGDRRLNQILSRYLYAVENGNIFIKCIDMGHDIGQKELVQEADIVCMVVPDYHGRLETVQKKRRLEYVQFLSDLQSDNFTEYFIRSRSFTLIDNYLNQDSEKYTVSELIPKGFLLGKIPPWSGNFFFKGIMDGHPEVLLLPYMDLNNNLFWYCLRLAEYCSDEILQNFWEIYDEESGDRERDFPDQGKFESSLGRFLRMSKFFTSQELFVMFHIAYVEMLIGEVSDIHQFVIYWEPHFVPRFDFLFLSDWLKDRKINGQTIELRRNNVIRTGSACARVTEYKLSPAAPFYNMFLDGTSWGGESDDESAFKMRFEDIKLHPREELEKVCEKMGIAWSDKMLKTTSCGQVSSYRGSTDFDLKPVFNKYDDFLSEFDRFRISIACSPYQKRYGYTYENCLKFSRRELQEMFLKPFLFESNELFEVDNKTHMSICEWIKWQLWDVRKHMVLDDIEPEFEQLQIK